MAHDAFISCSSGDREVADRVCRALESNGVRCWTAPRDIAAGVSFSEAIIQAIDSAQVLVLVLSAAANDSPQVLREVNRAVSKNIRVLPLRIENLQPTGSMDYLIGVTQWLDAFQGPLDTHLAKLSELIAGIVNMGQRAPDLSAALAAVDAALNELNAHAGLPGLGRVARVIEIAISFGAPVYNAGSHEDCAEIYLKTAHGLITSIDNHLQPNGGVRLSPRLTAVRDDLGRAVAAYPSVTRETAKSLAWEIRFAFDRTLRAELVSRGIAHVSRLLAEIKDRSEPLNYRDVSEVLKTSIGYGNLLHQENDFVNIVDLHLSTTRRVLHAIGEQPTGTDEADRLKLVAARKELASLFPIADYKAARAEDLERLSWAVYDAFMRILRADQVPVSSEGNADGPAGATSHQKPSGRIKVFISAKDSDYEHAEKIYDFLVSRGVRVFFSERSLQESGRADYRKAIDEALDEAKHMLVVASSAEHVRSEWVEFEWGSFSNEMRSGSKAGNLILVVVGTIARLDLPLGLRQVQQIPFDPESFDKLLPFVSR